MNDSNRKISRGSIQVPYGSKVYWKTDNPGYIEEKGVTQGEAGETVDLNLVKLIEVGDIILSKGSDIISVRPSDLTSTYQESGYTAVGIVVIPNSHNVYGDYSCGVVGLREVTNTVWGTGDIDSNLINFSRFGSSACIGENGSVGDSIVKLSTSAKLPSTGFSSSDGPNSLDNLGKYFDNSSEYAPSPYNSDGSRNVLYSQIDPLSSISNNLAEFSGKFNTRTFANASKTEDDYKAVTSSVSYPLSNLGEWYLPTVAELGYLCARLKEINESIQKIKEVFGNGTLSSISGKEYWSSTIGDGDVPMCVNMKDGSIIKKDKSSTLSLRSFFRVKEVRSINIVTLTINPTPSDATVVINGKIRNTISIFSGSIVNYDVYKDGYIISSKSITMGNEDKTIEVILDPAPSLGDVALWDGNKIVFSSPDTLNQFSSYVPIGIVAIPQDHNVYGNGCCGITSLDYKLYDNNEYQDITGTELSLFEYVPYIGLLKEETIQEDIIGIFSTSERYSSYLPSDRYESPSGLMSLDGESQYNLGKDDVSSTDTLTLSASPYKSYGIKNPVFSQTTEPSNNRNCFSDFNGKKNTEILLKTKKDIPYISYIGSYKTEGTKEGDWYLPSLGELAYVFVKLKFLDNSISKVISKFRKGEVIGPIGSYGNSGSNFTSSTYIKNSSRYLSCISFNGEVESTRTYGYSCYIKPMYQFPVLKTYTLTTGASDSVTVWINEEKVTDPTISVIAGTTINYVRSSNSIDYEATYGSFIMNGNKSIPSNSPYITLEVGDYLLSNGGCLKSADLTGDLLFLKSEIVGVFAGNQGGLDKFVRLMTSSEFGSSTRAWYGSTSTPNLQSGYVGGYPIGATTSESEARSRYQGKYSTDWILTTSTTSFGWTDAKPAAEFARSYGSKWYLPCAGELELVRANNTKIKEAVVKAGGASESIIPSSSIYLWVSTQATTQYAWSYSLNNGSMSIQSISYAGNFVLPMISL